eukprot:scaffold434_cov186-Pinguiococcus_pyrenoidosus.AAC.117
MGLRSTAAAGPPFSSMLGKSLLRDPLRFEQRRSLLLGTAAPLRYTDADVVKLYEVRRKGTRRAVEKRWTSLG